MKMKLRSKEWEEWHAATKVAEALETALSGLGLTAVLQPGVGHFPYPCLQVSLGRGADHVNLIYIAPDDSGIWQYWRSTPFDIDAETVAPAGDVVNAAIRIYRALVFRQPVKAAA
jgi:hypothetical protein